jgi:glycosyltransferase involved in cell wall biosynthesis
MKLLVVMPTYNSERYLVEAIQSILAQTFKDFRLIIVDDNSTDHSVSIAESFQDDRIRVVRNSRKIGMAKSLNVGLREDGAEFVARHDADDASLPVRFEKQIEFLREHPNVGLLGSSIFLMDETGQVFAKNILPTNVRSTLFAGNMICHGSVMLPAEVFEKVGSYSESVKWPYPEDYDLWLRIAKDYDVRNLRDCLYVWRIHKASTQSGKYASMTELKRHLAYGKIARKLSTVGADQYPVCPNDMESLLSLREKLGACYDWAYALVGTRLWRRALGRVTLNMYHSLLKRRSSRNNRITSVYFVYTRTMPMILRSAKDEI